MRKQTIIHAFQILKNDGVGAFIKRIKVHNQYIRQIKKSKMDRNFKDILFINGCPIDYCERYRIHHKIQELTAYGLSCDEVADYELTEEIIKYYRAFIIYRTPWSEHVQTFVDLAHQQNKIVFYDIDDLVFDLEYTKNIKEVKRLAKEQREEYDDGVVRYGKLLDACDYGITTTKVIAKEMKKHVKDACIDKNIASLQMQKYSEKAIKITKKEEDKIIIGYASGSITHNADFELIASSLMKILDKYNNVYLKLIGVLEIPKEFEKYQDRIIKSHFVNYTKLPFVLRSLDINLAPLENTFFNTAKSSIKWMEASLVKVPTIASDVGNFHDCITNEVDGILVKEDEWYEKLEKLVTDKEYREKIGYNAYKKVYENYTPISSGKVVTDFIKSKMNKNICFIIPSTNISGGVLVALKHALILRKNGYDVSMLNTDLETKNVTKLYEGNDFISVIPFDRGNVKAKIDILVATMWFTANNALEYFNSQKVKYLVQNKEDGFYKPDTDESLKANATYYLDNIEYLTISKWCQKWLETDFNRQIKYAPNGIDLTLFPFKKRNFKGKIRIVIEGDSESHYKNVDESFKITNQLNRDKYEVYYLSYNGEPKDWYMVDKFYNKVTHDKVYEIYQECDILLKSSILESFSYPPLEMMATGGVCVVVPNEGNMEYLEDNKNCLFYEQGNVEEAIEKIEQIVKGKTLRDKLIKNGLETAKSRDWQKIEKEILNLYK